MSHPRAALKPEGPEILNMGAPRPPRGGRHGPPVTYRGVGDGIWGKYGQASNAAIGAHQARPRGVAPEWLFGPEGVSARGACRDRRGGPGFLPNRPGFAAGTK
jgi:hypothetical protein